MKKTFFLFFVSVIILTTVKGQAGLVTASGADFIIDPGIFVINAGDVDIANGSTLTNNGYLQLKGDLTSNGTSTLGSGIFAFEGSNPQLVSGSVAPTFNTIISGNEIQLGIPLTVTTLLDMQSGKIILGSHNLSISSSGTIQGYSQSNYIIADASGRLVMRVGNSPKTFPVGTALTYVPLTLVNSGTADFFRLRVFPDVLDAGTSGSTITSVDHAVEMTWVLEENVAGGSNLTISPQWNLSDEGSVFDRNSSGIGHYTSGSWVPQSATTASGSNPYSLTRLGITSTGAFAVGDYQTPLSFAVGITLDLTEFLEGPFAGSAMYAALYPAGVIPLSQPYSASPWNYNGTESVASIPNPDVVDWVLVELRDALNAASANSSTTIAKKAAFIMTDGTIRNLDGSSLLTFTTPVSSNLFVVIWHRNHLPVMSASPLLNVGGIYSYDFTVSAAQVYGDALGHKQLATSAWGMMSGDGDANSQVNNSDKNNVWKVQTGQSGYKAGDFNLDAQVNNTDKIGDWKPNTGKASQVP